MTAKFNWNAPRKDRSQGFPNPDSRSYSRLPAGSKVPSAIRGLRKQVVRIDPATRAPIVDYAMDDRLAERGVLWMVAALGQHYENQPLHDDDQKLLEAAAATPHRFIGNERLLRWFGGALCRTPTMAADQRKKFEAASTPHRMP